MLRNLLASRAGQLAFDFRIEAQHAKVLQLKRRQPPPMAALTDSPPLVEELQPASIRGRRILDDGNPENFEQASTTGRCLRSIRVARALSTRRTSIIRANDTSVAQALSPVCHRT